MNDVNGWVGFPHLFNLKFNISKVAFNIFGISIFWYALIIVTGVCLAIYLGMRDSKKFGMNSENIIDLVLFAVPIAVIFARAYFVIFNWNLYKNASFLERINIRNGGLAIYGGLIGALIVTFVFARYKKIRFLSLLDFLIPYMILAQGIGRWGNFVNQEAYGTPTSLPWGMTGSRIGDTPVHPTFLYESIWDIGVFFLLLWFRKKKKIEGEVFFLYMIMYGLARLWIEPLRTDSLMIGSFRVSWVLALIFIVTFSVLFTFRRKRALQPSGEIISTGSSEYGYLLKQLKEDSKANEEIIENNNNLEDTDRHGGTGKISSENESEKN